MLGNRKSSRVLCSIAKETTETYERLSQRPQTIKNVLSFLVELKPLFHKVFKQTCMLQLISIKPSDRITLQNKHAVACTRGGGGMWEELPHDAHQLAQGCEFRILVSLRVFSGCSEQNVKVCFRVAREDIPLFRERLLEKGHATIPKGIVGGFKFTVL